MPNSGFAFALFISSYSPALLILAVRSFNHSTGLFAASLALAVLSVASFLIFIKVARKGGPFRATVKDVEPQDAELAAYVATYLLPFVVVFGATLQDIIALALFLFFIGILWVNSGMIYLNPLLALMGYHVYIAHISPAGADETGSLPRTFLLSRRRGLRPGDEVLPDRIGSNVYIDLAPTRDATS